MNLSFNGLCNLVWPLTKFRKVYIEHLQGVWYATKGSLLLLTPGLVPFLTWLCSNVETSFSETCHVSVLWILYFTWSQPNGNVKVRRSNTMYVLTNRKLYKKKSIKNCLAITTCNVRIKLLSLSHVIRAVNNTLSSNIIRYCILPNHMWSVLFIINRYLR